MQDGNQLRDNPLLLRGVLVATPQVVEMVAITGVVPMAQYRLQFLREVLGVLHQATDLAPPVELVVTALSLPALPMREELQEITDQRRP